MLLAELFAMVEIDAPAERVWQVLTDFRRYPEWNPFMPRVAGEAARRAELEVLVRPDGVKAAPAEAAHRHVPPAARAALARGCGCPDSSPASIASSSRRSARRARA